MVKTQKKILIIEDDKFLGKLLARSIEEHGHEVAIASSGKEALEQLAASKPALVLLDVILPDMNGFEILEKIRSDAQFKKLPVIIISNLGQDEDVKQGKALGITDYIVKSDMSLDEVSNKILKYLEK